MDDFHGDYGPDNPYAPDGGNHPDAVLPRTSPDIRKGILWTISEEEEYASRRYTTPPNFAKDTEAKMNPPDPKKPNSYMEGKGVLVSPGAAAVAAQIKSMTYDGPRVLPLPGGQYPPVDFQQGAPDRTQLSHDPDVSPRAWHDPITVAAYDLFILALKAEQARDRGEST